MVHKAQLRLVALCLALVLSLLPLSAGAIGFDGPRDDSPRFEQRVPVVVSLWQRVVDTWLKASSSISPNGRD
jgi:hypothetical protein